MNYSYMFMRDSLIIKLYGDLDHHLADEMRENIDNIIHENKIRSIVFDFTEVAFMDSSGIGFIMGRYKKMKQRGIVAIVNPKKSINRILLISGLHKLVKVYDDLEAAISANEERIMEKGKKGVGLNV